MPLQIFVHLGLYCCPTILLPGASLGESTSLKHFDCEKYMSSLCWLRVFSTIIRCTSIKRCTWRLFSLAQLSTGSTCRAIPPCFLSSPQGSLLQGRNFLNSLYLKEKMPKPKCLLIAATVIVTWCLSDNDNLALFLWLTYSAYSG